MTSKEQVESLYSQGITVKAIALLLGIGEQTLHRRMAVWGIPKRSRSETNRMAWMGRGQLPRPSIDELRKLYLEDKLSTHTIAVKFAVSQWTVLKWCREYAIPTRSLSESEKLRGFTGSKNPAWKGGRRYSATGHVQILCPEHARASKSGYVMEHILVWEKAHERPLPEGYVLHHINGIPDDNRPSNLRAMRQREHMQLHHKCLKDMEGMQVEIEQLFGEVIKLQVELSLVWALLNQTEKALTLQRAQEAQEKLKKELADG